MRIFTHLAALPGGETGTSLVPRVGLGNSYGLPALATQHTGGVGAQT